MYIHKKNNLHMQHEQQQYTKRENYFIIIITMIKCKAQEDRAKKEDSDFSRCPRKSGGTVCDHSEGCWGRCKKCLNQDTCAPHAVKFITNSASITEGREGGQQ